MLEIQTEVRVCRVAGNSFQRIEHSKLRKHSNFKGYLSLLAGLSNPSNCLNETLLILQKYSSILKQHYGQNEDKPIMPLNIQDILLFYRLLPKSPFLKSYH